MDKANLQRGSAQMLIGTCASTFCRVPYLDPLCESLPIPHWNLTVRLFQEVHE